MSSFNSSIPDSPRKSLHFSDLQSPKKTRKLKETNDVEFEAHCQTANREIETLRHDIQVLMTKAHAYCQNTGIGSDDLFLPSTPPRYGNSSNSIFSPKSGDSSTMYLSSPSRTKPY